jgi:thiol-disulfide isomerase/thioredoxin
MIRLVLILIVSWYYLFIFQAFSQVQLPIKSEYNTHLNKELPNFNAKELNNEVFSLRKNRGKIVLLNFWGLSCAACFKEIPELNKLSQEFKEKVIVVSVLEDTREKALNRILITENGYRLKRKTFNNDLINYILIPDGKEIIMQYFNDFTYPRNFIIDQNGKLSYYSGGYLELFTENDYVEDANYKNLRAVLLQLTNK